MHAQRHQGAPTPSPACSASTTTGSTTLALAAPPGAGGLALLPVPRRRAHAEPPDATGRARRAPLRRRRREQLARAAFEGVVCGLLDGLDALAAHVPSRAAGCVLDRRRRPLGGLPPGPGRPGRPRRSPCRRGRAGGRRALRAGGRRAAPAGRRPRSPRSGAWRRATAVEPGPTHPPRPRCGPPTRPGATPRRERPVPGARPAGDGDAGRGAGGPAPPGQVGPSRRRRRRARMREVNQAFDQAVRRCSGPAPPAPPATGPAGHGAAAPRRPAAVVAGRRIQYDEPSFTIDVLPVDAFAALRASPPGSARSWPTTRPTCSRCCCRSRPSAGAAWSCCPRRAARP